LNLRTFRQYVKKLINNILRQYLNQSVIIYLNDIIIYSNILKKYINYVFKVLKCLNKRNLHLKSKKCEFYRKKVNFLEFIVKRHKVRINFEKLQAIKE